MFVFNNNHFAEDRFLHSLIFFRRLLPAVHKKEKSCLGRLKKCLIEMIISKKQS